MTPAEPIRDDELAGLFAKTLRYPIALAVSGGPDSVALLHLVHRWMLLSHVAIGGNGVVVLTIDHGLRIESAVEARWVATLAQRLGFRHEALIWQGEKPATGIQAAAREARYRLMQGFVAREGLERALVTAHHQDDQAETLLMRLARGSGVDGLAGMRTCSEAHGLVLVRPLLGVPKARLVATLETASESWIEDPSNVSESFERVRWRNAQPALAALGLSNVQLALSARRLARAREALEAAAFDFACRAGLDLHEGAYASLFTSTFREAPEELRVRLMTRLLSQFGGQAVQPSLAGIEELCGRLQSTSPETRTLGGCIVSSEGGAIEVCREMAREGLPVIELRAGEQKVWDRRFAVTFRGGRETDEVSVGALGEAGWRDVRKRLGPSVRLPHRAAPTLPAFRAGGLVVSVPPLGIHVPADGRQLCAASFIWPGNAPGWPKS